MQEGRQGSGMGWHGAGNSPELCTSTPELRKGPAWRSCTVLNVHEGKAGLTQGVAQRSVLYLM